MQVESLRGLENENGDIGSHAYSTSLYVVHHYRASRSSKFVCHNGRIEPPHTRCVRLSVIWLPFQTLIKVRYAIKSWSNCNRCNIILNGEILLNLIRKMKYLTDQFQLCFLPTLNSYILFLHWQQRASCSIQFVLPLHSSI